MVFIKSIEMKQITIMCFLASLSWGYGQVYDYDGNAYNTVQIGNQTWMSENLKTSKYNNGDDIPNVPGAVDWIYLESGAWVHFDNDPSYESTHGKLYNWHVVNDERGVCPTGYHVPNQIEWDTLKQYIASQGYTDMEGYALKSVSGWEEYNGASGGGDDAFGFSANPSGRRYHQNFNTIDRVTYHWLADSAASGARHGVLHFANQEMPINIYSAKFFGLSVRCMTSNETGGTTGTSGLENQELIGVYPNPVHNTLHFSTLPENISSIDIIDSKGRAIEIRHFSGESINLRDLPEGIYTLRIQHKKGITSKKFIKH
jgi:uncharacterized protein (TIGR02145 family)